MFIILYVLLQLLRVVEIVIIARCVLSFLPGLRETKVAAFINWVTEPVLQPARSVISKFMPDGAPQVDFSPIATYLAIMLLRTVLQSIMATV
ncbi:MAG: YggT family protein [Oscillospiraceae bacterium]|nr:YggT family protein [Oscillospiraceae bacterium]